MPGHLVEVFFACELLEHLGFSTLGMQLRPYRTQSDIEVDFVPEDRAGRLTGIEVMASASVDGSDFKGLRHLPKTESAAFNRAANHHATTPPPVSQGVPSTPRPYDSAPNPLARYPERGYDRGHIRSPVVEFTIRQGLGRRMVCNKSNLKDFSDLPASPPPRTALPLTVSELVVDCIKRRTFFLERAGEHGSPLYIIEQQSLLTRTEEFWQTFRPFFPDFDLYYSVKTNSHPDIVKTMLSAGAGIEVASGQELDEALAAGASEILFNGPGKTDAELELALAHADKVTVIMDSFGELERLSILAAQQHRTIRTGVRLAVVGEGGNWDKFGIAPESLADFTEQAAASPHIDLQGLHFHSSWNMAPTAQVAMLERIGAVLPTCQPEIIANLRFIDIGGGFWPEWGEWLPAQGAVHAPFHTTEPAAPLQRFAEAIAEACNRHIFPHLRCSIYAEPGRWICSGAASILLTVQDVKGDGVAITDGGTNMVGWEQFESEYFPIINLTHPEIVERPYNILGSLCTPRDLWGRSFFGSELRTGDLLLIPYQGAYTYSLRQQFIKQLPKTVFVPVVSEDPPEQPWGLSCSVDIYDCNPDTIRDPDAIRRFVAELCALIRLRPFGETQVVQFGDDERVAGYSMTQLIETSLLSGHFADRTNTAYLDIFSCSPYAPETVASFARQFFGGSRTVINVTLRH